MGNVLVVVAGDYPDMESVHERLLKGSKTEHVTFRRPGDKTMKGIGDVLGLEFQVYEPKNLEIPFRLWTVDSDGECEPKRAYRPMKLEGMAYVEAALNWFDFVIVYGTETSSVTKPYVDKVKKEQIDGTLNPYSLIFSHKVEVNQEETVLVKRRKGRKQ